MVKLGSPLVQYGSTTTNNDTIPKVKTIESPPSTKSKSSSFSFITSGYSIRDYIKRKLFKATKEEVSSLIKSTSNLNLAGKFSSKSSKSKSSSKCKSAKVKDEDKVNGEVNNQWNQSQDNQCMIIDDEMPIRPTEVSLITESQSIEHFESSSETQVVEIKSCRRFSLIRLSKRKKKKARFADDLTQSLPAPSCSTSSSPGSLTPPLNHKGVSNVAKKMKKCKVKSYDPLNGKVAPIGKSDDQKEKKEEKKEPVKWTKRFRKFAIRSCRYLGYGAQMVAPLTPYTDIPMPVTYDGTYSVYPPYYGSNHYYSYSSCGSVYGYTVSHYGLTY